MPVKFGANGHPAWSHGNFTLSQQLDLVKQAGLSSYRVDVGGTNDATMLNNLFTLGAQKGVEILPVIVLHPEDYATEAAARTAGYNLANSLAAQFPGKTWELGNEYDNEAIKGSSYSGALSTDYDNAKYAIMRGLIDGMYDGAKAADSTAKTVVGDAGWFHHGFLDRLAADGVTWDITATHWYSDMGSITSIGGSSTNALKEHADFGKPIYVTEFNGRPDAMTETQMGTWDTNFMTQLNNNAATYNVQQAHIYEILDQPEFGTSAEARYGLFNTDGTFTPSGTAVDSYMDSLTPPAGDTPTFTTQNFTGTSADETIIGNDLNNTINANPGNDIVKGGNGNDFITGHEGTDTLTGGAGNDVFDYNSIQPTTDRITDFQNGNDDIDLTSIDANTAVTGDQAFAWIGAAAFSAPGQVRYFTSATDTTIQMSNDGDLSSEMSIILTGVKPMVALDFLL